MREYPQAGDVEMPTSCHATQAELSVRILRNTVRSRTSCYGLGEDALVQGSFRVQGECCLSVSLQSGAGEIK
jgi:hypothetical protein